MKALSTLVFLSLIGIVFSNPIPRVSFIKPVNVTEGSNVTLVGVEGAKNTTWTKYHLNGWKHICNWSVTVYTCEGVNLTIVNATSAQNGRIQGQSVSDSEGYYTQHTFIYDIKVIPLPTPSPPSTTQTTTSTQPTATTTAEAFLLLPPSSSPTASTNKQTTKFLSTTESHTTATLRAFSSTANLTSLSYTLISSVTTSTPASLPTPLKQTEGGLQWQITLLIVIGVVILAMLLYFIFCRRIPNAKPVYKPIVIGQPEPLQVEGGLRNLLFSFTVW
ncbi:membrane glycoprotein E3 CR1-delta [Human adenovirus 4]|uniref:Membrane glycoprotein E3 CR1-delta n=2 Tax=Human mastadenovirus E TaxID=130308 RepID=A0A1U9AL40_ADE04|nr:membrane glycoprotein E3 CR1-delta [Human adenovirus E4]ANQ44165.1 membrane glycoprotein E3 CR1-delta [Human adenovirus E4]ANQ44241.1 membrane glycoprotein E3 CR1-delta [Human adenovirus E4]AVD49647.1 CR1-delta1 [Human mastadenovirus E]